MAEDTEKPEAQAPPPEEPKPQPAEGEQPEPEQSAEQEQRAGDRRWARTTARMAALARERDDLARMLAEAQQRQQQAPQGDPAVEQLIAQEVNRRVKEKTDAAKTRAFHAAGNELYPDWQERCTALQAMGADPHIARILVGLPNGPRVAAALHDEPDELDRIAALDPDDRGVELGKFAAKLETRPARPVSKAPRPPQPVTQRSAPQFNEYTATPAELMQHYSKPGARPP